MRLLSSVHAHASSESTVCVSQNGGVGVARQTKRVKRASGYARGRLSGETVVIVSSPGPPIVAVAAASATMSNMATRGFLGRLRLLFLRQVWVAKGQSHW